MFGKRFDRRHIGKNLIAVEALRDKKIRQFGMTAGDRSGLVEGDGTDPGECLQGFSLAKEDAELSPSAGANHD